MRAGSLAIQLTESSDRLCSIVHVAGRSQEPADAIVDQLWHGSAPKCDHWRASRHRFDHRQAKRLIELNQMQQGRRTA